MSELIDRILDEFKDINYAYNDCTKFDTLKSMLSDAVPVRHGEWIFNPADGIEAMFTKPKCSLCGFESSDGLNYCPNCGAKMMEVQE